MDIALICLSLRDDRIKRLIEAVGEITREYNDDIFRSLIESIISQQLSSRASDTIISRLNGLIKRIEPYGIINTDEEELRSIGISIKKIGYMKGLAEAVIKGELNLERIRIMSDQEVINCLIKYKGIGVWTAEMVLIFSLKRPDVLPLSDLGIRRGLTYVFGTDIISKEMFSPYNTLLSFYLWEAAGRGEDWVKNTIDPA